MKATKALDRASAQTRLDQLMAMVEDDEQLDLVWVEAIAREAVLLGEALDDHKGQLVRFYHALALVKAGSEREGLGLLENVLGKDFIVDDLELKAKLICIVVERGFVQLGTELAYNVLDEVERSAEPSLDLCRQLVNIGHALARASHTSDARSVFFATLEVARKLDSLHELVPTLLRGLAWREHDLHQCESALRLAKECWQLVQAKEDHGYSSDGCQTQMLIAAVLEEMGEFAEAEVAHKLALAIAKKALGEDEVSRATNNYTVLLFLTRRLDEAHTLLLTLPQFRVSEEERDYGSPPVCNLAEVLFGLGQVERAFVINEKSIAALENGDNKAPYRQYMVHGDILASLGRYEEAGQMHAKAVDVIHETLAGNEKALGEVYIGMGTALGKQGRWEEAEAQLTKGCDLIHRVVGKNNARLAMGLRELAQTQHKNGKDAVEVARNALQVCESLFVAGKETLGARAFLEELLSQR